MIIPYSGSLTDNTVGIAVSGKHPGLRSGYNVSHTAFETVLDQFGRPERPQRDR